MSVVDTAEGNEALLRVRIVRADDVANDIILLELLPEQGQSLPLFFAGSHVDVHLPNGLIRQYSLCNSDVERHRYCIAVAKAKSSRGGSSYIHAQIKKGQCIEISKPRNIFPLLDADAYRFIAGGIGITPILSMLYACENAGKRWKLLYCARNRASMAFLPEIIQFTHGQVFVHLDEESNGDNADFASFLENIEEKEHVYCCGPGGLMQAVNGTASDHTRSRFHFEQFSVPQDIESAKFESEGFEVVLRRSARRIWVGPNQSVLEALELEGISVPFSCRDGLCGTCQTKVICGEVDHRDYVLSHDEKAKNESIMICVSRSKSGCLELDL